MKKTPLFYTILIIGSTLATPVQADNFFQSLATFFSTLAESSTPKSNPKYTLTRKQVESYINLYISSINQALYPNITLSDIKTLNTKIEHGITIGSDLYIWIQGVRWYDKDKIDQIILSAILEIIEENSYCYTLQQTNDHAIAHKISQSMLANALAITQKTSILNPIDLKSFFGFALHNTINQAIQNLHTPSIHVYQSAICCICSDRFSSSVERVFLYPCGHDMCKLCALEYFFENHGNRKTCPQCHGMVNLEQLFEDLEI